MRTIELGQIVITEGIASLLGKNGSSSYGEDLHVMTLLTRHLLCDWGNVDDEDKAANDQAVEDGSRILSAYKLYGEKVWIITEWDRSVTTLLFPNEY